MIDPNDPQLSVVKQCRLVSISCSTFYYHPCPENPLNLHLMRLIDEQYLRTPWYGARQMVRYLCCQGRCVGRKRIRRLMRVMGLVSIAPKPNTSRKSKGHPVYPYLLRDLTINRPNQVWCADVNYVPHGPWVLISERDHGLVFTKGAVLAAIDDPGQSFLCGGIGRSHRTS